MRRVSERSLSFLTTRTMYPSGRYTRPFSIWNNFIFSWDNFSPVIDRDYVSICINRGDKNGGRGDVDRNICWRGKNNPIFTFSSIEFAKGWKFRKRKEKDIFLNFVKASRKVKRNENGWKGDRRSVQQKRERIDGFLEKRRGGGGGIKKEKREGEGNQMHAQFNRFPEDPLNAALKASATNRSNLWWS